MISVLLTVFFVVTASGLLAKKCWKKLNLFQLANATPTTSEIKDGEFMKTSKDTIGKGLHLDRTSNINQGKEIMANTYI